MSSERQIKANQANAAKSTGPRTGEGKQRSSQNAEKRGYNSARPVVLNEEIDHFLAIETGLREELKPQGMMEEIYFSEIVRHSWNLQRLDREEIAFGPKAFHQPKNLPALNLILRYRGQARRQLDSAYRNLLQLQENRRAAAETAVDETKPIPAGPKPVEESKPKPKEQKLSLIFPPKSLFPIT